MRSLAEGGRSKGAVWSERVCGQEVEDIGENLYLLYIWRKNEIKKVNIISFLPEI